MLILPDNEEAYERAAQVVASGGILAFRTDTFYGLGADPFNRSALKHLFQLKGRDEGKPILVIISDALVVERFFAARTALFETVSERHWPGALTLVGEARSDVPEELTAGTRSIGLRLPDDERVRALVRACGGALTATSANLSGKPPARTAADVARSFPEGLALILDAGATLIDRPSTVLDVRRATARLIREGVVTARELRRTLISLELSLESEV
ncbi:MAG TPA: L-threonylcarbamoyladenylate synthase [Pyrinomonadaceae bacterium]|jgi:L-threonylcarbamoyladenylate synthase